MPHGGTLVWATLPPEQMVSHATSLSQCDPLQRWRSTDSLLALVNSSGVTGGADSARRPSSHPSTVTGRSPSPSTPTPVVALGLSGDSNVPNANDQPTSQSPGAVSQIALSPVTSPLPEDMTSPSTAISQRSFAALNAARSVFESYLYRSSVEQIPSRSDASPQMDQDLFSSPPHGTLWNGIGNMDVRTPPGNGVANAFRPGAYTGFLPLDFPKSPSPVNLLTYVIHDYV